jgi:hypothetical protein
MFKAFAIASLGAALLAAGAYSPQAQVKSADTLNITVVEKNQFWPLAGPTIDLCDLSRCQDI